MYTIFKMLKGAWRLTKITYDKMNQRTYKFIGKATFKQLTKNELLFREDGEYINPLTQEKLNTSSSREYLYTYEDESINVYFAKSNKRDGLFHRLNRKDLEKKKFDCFHPCKKDTYQTQYRFFNNDEFTIKHIVNGPKKNYTTETTYKRESNSGNSNL